MSCCATSGSTSCTNTTRTRPSPRTSMRNVPTGGVAASCSTAGSMRLPRKPMPRARSSRLMPSITASVTARDKGGSAPSSPLINRETDGSATPHARARSRCVYPLACNPSRIHALRSFFRLVLIAQNVPGKVVLCILSPQHETHLRVLLIIRRTSFAHSHPWTPFAYLSHKHQNYLASQSAASIATSKQAYSPHCVSVGGSSFANPTSQTLSKGSGNECDLVLRRHFRRRQSRVHSLSNSGSHR